jgi:DNA-binding response OmpR family regulator
MRILLIEDDHDLRNYIASRLQEKCFAIDAAADGDRGLYLARSNSYDVIILDYALPGKSGYDVCRYLREHGNKTPIIMISGIGEIPHKINGYDLGIDDYITKPFFFEELHARIRTIMYRPFVTTFEQYSFGDLVLDTRTQEVTRAGERIYLTRKEYQLLECLMQHPGDVVTRGHMIDTIWDSDIDQESNTIETHIMNLRRKVQTAGSNPIIHSVPGRGYKIAHEKYS